MTKTKIIYEAEMDCEYDLVNQPFRRAKMFEKIAGNVEAFGGLEALRDRIQEEALELRMNIDPKVQKWFTLIKQVEFMNLVIEGKIKPGSELEMIRTSEVDL